MNEGIRLIAEERKKQIEVHNWAPEHDKQHTDESLAHAAMYYAAPESLIEKAKSKRINLLKMLWPSSWHKHWAKRDKKDRLRRLVVAGALIAAEIDRVVEEERLARLKERLDTAHMREPIRG